MMVADKTFNASAVRIVTGLVTLVMVAGAAAPSHADPAKAGRAPAPIVYAASAPDAPVVRFENKLESRPVAAPVRYGQHAAAPLTFDQFQGRTTGPSAPIDLRPGAERVSFGPSAPSFAAPDAMPRPLASKPLIAPSQSISWAEPYAGPAYQVAGKWYVPTHEPNYDEVGIASWYGPTFHGKASATGEVFDEMAMTAAHPTLPIPSLVRVTNLENGKSVVVRINDRGPFVDDRIIDMSKAAAYALDMTKKGTAKVRVQYVGPAPAAPNAVPSEAVLASMQQAPVQVTRVQASQALSPSYAPQPYASQQMSPVATESPVMPTADAAAPIVRQPVAARPAMDARGFYLQAGSFSDLSNAHALRDRLKAVGPVEVTSAQVNGAEFYRVMVGPWSSRADAERMQGRLIEQGQNAMVVAHLDN
jgi:rare lipoprotein A